MTAWIVALVVGNPTERQDIHKTMAMPFFSSISPERTRRSSCM